VSASTSWRTLVAARCLRMRETRRGSAPLMEAREGEVRPDGPAAWRWLRRLRSVAMRRYAVRAGWG